MRFSLLGPQLVTGDDGRAVTCTAGQRQTLTVLLLAGAAVTRGALTDALWGDDPPATPLRRRISQVRAIVGAGRLSAAGGGYYLRVDPGELDYDEFKAHLKDGRGAMDAGSPEAASLHLQQALDLCTGPVLPYLPQTPFMIGVAGRVEAELAEARDLLIDARLDLGQHREIVAGLREAVAAEPLKEHTWAQLMLAEYRCGNISAALASFTRARRVLRDEAGTDPGPELTDLQSRMLARDPGLAYRPHAPAPAAGAPLRSWTWTAVHQLPVPASDFTGRARDLEMLARELSGPAMTVTLITGPLGTGKTALAVYAAHQADDAFPDGQLHVFLGGAASRRDPQEVLAEMLHALGVAPELIPPPGPAREKLYRSMLAHRKVLVVADDATDAAQIRPLLPGTAGAAVLVTSRSRSAFADLESVRLVELGDMPPGDALALLRAICGPGKAASDDVYAAIAGACDYLPLALRIAGARLAFDPDLLPEDLVRALAGPERLAELAIGDLSVRARLDTAYAALAERERALLRLVAACPTGDIPGWLPPVLAGDADAALSANAIAQAGLLRPVTTGTRTRRYRMPSLVRDYAAALAADDPPDAITGARERMVAGWIELADHASRQLPRHPCVPAPPALAAACVTIPGDYAAIAPDALAWLAAERDNLIAVTEAACGRGDYASAAALAERLFAAQCQGKAYDDARRLWQQIGAEGGRAGDTLAAAIARHRLAVLAIVHGDAPVTLSLAVRDLGACLWEFRRARRYVYVADTDYLLARCAIADDEPSRARHHAEAGLEEARNLGDPRLEILNLSVLGVALIGPGDPAEGIAYCERALEMATELREPGYAELAWWALGKARELAGRPAGTWSWHNQETG